MSQHDNSKDSEDIESAQTRGHLFYSDLVFFQYSFIHLKLRFYLLLFENCILVPQ